MKEVRGDIMNCNLLCYRALYDISKHYNIKHFIFYNGCSSFFKEDDYFHYLNSYWVCGFRDGYWIDKQRYVSQVVYHGSISESLWQGSDLKSKFKSEVKSSNLNSYHPS